ncbi:MAG: aldo/keto reductase [Candidatus Eremiobacteraeota bacterium]|nr:aldo/keto reductase [Candidatus Eremiobacteraeota bacterium]
MKYHPLGKTGLEVSFLSLGTLTLGPLQADLSPPSSRQLLLKARSLGVNLFDTAELYGTYRHIGEAFPRHDSQVLVSSRSYAATAGEMEQSLRRALEETGRPSIELFMVHQQESEHTLRGHYQALRYLAGAKRRGLVKAVGISTHHVAAAAAALLYEEIEVVFAILNHRGLGIQDGTAQDMRGALEALHGEGKGIMVMKALGGGHFYREAEMAFRFLRELPFVATVTVGARDENELLMDYLLLHGMEVPQELARTIGERERRLHVEDCQRCGACVERCPNKALSLGEEGAELDAGRCLLCGYCAAACPEFCIKVL